MMIMLPHFKYKASLIANTEHNGTKNGVKIAVPLKCLIISSISLKIPLIICKVEPYLAWDEDCVLVTADNTSNATFKVTEAKLYVPLVTLSTEDNEKLRNQSSEGFERPVYWNKYKVIDNKVVEIARGDNEKNIKERLDASSQGVKRLLVLAYDDTPGDNQVSVDSFKKYLLPRVIIENYNIETDGKSFYDQPINDSNNTTKSGKYQQNKIMVI